MMASRNASFHDDVLVGVLYWPLRFAFTLALAMVTVLVFAWVVDWVFVFKVWPEGVEHLRHILAMDLAYGLDLAERQGNVLDVVTLSANLLYELVFEVTGFHDMGMRFSEGGALSIPDTVVRNAYLAKRDEIEVAMIATQLLGVRIGTLLLMSSLLLLVYVVAAADGLTERAIRRASGGRESSGLYHRAKYMQIVALGTVGLAVILWPAPVGWESVMVLLAVVMFFFVRLQWTYYKKHL